MPRQTTAVKYKLESQGLVDIHFHGAFGIDLMTANAAELNDLSEMLWQNGMAGFCATTLSTPPAQLLETVTRLGEWIDSKAAPGARPLGIHLEGPFVSSHACGAHPPETIRPVDFEELEKLWQASRHTLKILTIAPETLDLPRLKRLCRWSADRNIILSLGHSRATEAQARQAFDLGFSGVTHAWNALAFHHRAPGPLGAALGDPKVHVELIIDQIHVDPTLMRWTMALHPKNTCFVSDCVPAAATRSGTWHSFGPLKIQYKDGACRLSGDHLAGGGRLLPEMYVRWLQHEAARGAPIKKLFEATIANLTTVPLKALKISPRALATRRVFWQIPTRGSFSCNPIQG